MNIVIVVNICIMLTWLILKCVSLIAKNGCQLLITDHPFGIMLVDNCIRPITLFLWKLKIAVE
jgi:hypothetical protein